MSKRTWSNVVNDVTEPAPLPTMTAEQWYAADIAAREALAIATAARHQDWLAECAAVQARSVADVAVRTRCAVATEAHTEKMQELHAAILAMPAGDGVPISALVEIIKLLAAK